MTPAIKKYLPDVPAVTAEVFAVLIGTVVAAFIISKYPSLKKFVVDNSVTLHSGGPFLNEN
jgi:hypothetical protein